MDRENRRTAAGVRTILRALWTQRQIRLNGCLTISFFVDETTDQAIKKHGPPVQWFLDKLKQVSGSAVDQPKIVKGYELSGTQGPKTVAMGFQTYEEMLQYGAAIAGIRKPVSASCGCSKRGSALPSSASGSIWAGSIPKVVERSMRLAAEKVFPLRVGRGTAFHTNARVRRRTMQATATLG